MLNIEIMAEAAATSKRDAWRVVKHVMDRHGVNELTFDFHGNTWEITRQLSSGSLLLAARLPFGVHKANATESEVWTFLTSDSPE